MKIDKVFNNNVVQVTGSKGEEQIVMGKGLGFQKKPGDVLDPDLIEKTFRSDSGNLEELSRVYVDISDQEADLILDIIDRGQELLEENFEFPLYLSLADHLHYTLERSREGLQLQNPLAWEVRKLFPQEYQLGKEALSMIKEELALELDEIEAASIALHFINARKETSLGGKNQLISKIVIEILEIVRLQFGHFNDEDSLVYNRFITHVQYFAQRVANGVIQGNNDAFLYDQVAANYPQAFACSEKIKTYMEAHYEFPMSVDEQVYLAIHIQRLEASRT